MAKWPVGRWRSDFSLWRSDLRRWRTWRWRNHSLAKSPDTLNSLIFSQLSQLTFTTKSHLTYDGIFQELSSFLFNTICYFWITIKGSRLLKKFTFDSGNYLNMWVTFDVFTCNRMIKLKIASKRSELDCNN